MSQRRSAAAAAEAMRTPVTRVLVCAQLRVYREALVDMLERCDELSVVGAADPGETFAALEELEPDVVLLDVGRGVGREVVRELAGANGARIVALLDLEQGVMPYVEAGLSGLVGQDDSPEDVVEAIRCAARGAFGSSARTAEAVLRQIAVTAAERSLEAPAERLTAREREVMTLLAAGLSNKQIAVRLHIGLATVKHHVHHILEKLGVSRRAEAVALWAGFSGTGL